jgi:hypothetical protein
MKAEARQVYSAERPQVLDEVLADCERRVAECRAPTCDRRALIKTLYHTIPEAIHTQYIDTIENREYEMKQRKKDFLHHTLNHKEVIAYPNRTMYESDARLYAIAMGVEDSGVGRRVRLEPEVLSFGLQYVGYIDQR